MSKDKTGYPDDEDGAVLADLAAEGIDMTKPVLIEFAVAVPDQASADRAMKDIADAGYDVELEYDEGEPDENGEIDPNDDEFGPSWTILANVHMTPEYNEVIRIQEDLDRLAKPFGGSSDGWGVFLDEDGDA